MPYASHNARTGHHWKQQLTYRPLLWWRSFSFR